VQTQSPFQPVSRLGENQSQASAASRGAGEINRGVPQFLDERHKRLSPSHAAGLVGSSHSAGKRFKQPRIENRSLLKCNRLCGSIERNVLGRSRLPISYWHANRRAADGIGIDNEVQRDPANLLSCRSKKKILEP